MEGLPDYIGGKGPRVAFVEDARLRPWQRGLCHGMVVLEGREEWLEGAMNISSEGGTVWLRGRRFPSRRDSRDILRWRWMICLLVLMP